jgi:hypothetical protein
VLLLLPRRSRAFKSALRIFEDIVRSGVRPNGDTLAALWRLATKYGGARWCCVLLTSVAP